MANITDIKNYILFLKKECGLSITLHPCGDEALILTSELISFNIHDNPYCIYIKSCGEAYKHCIERQSKVKEKAERGSYSGTCYAGVKEFIYPIMREEEVIGFICVSGYKCDRPSSYINSVAESYALPPEELKAVYASLKSDMPSKERIDTLIMPLCSMLELAYSKIEGREYSDEKFADKIVRYLKQYHTQNISSEDICRHFSCSRSYMSHQFNKHIGKSIKQYLAELRIEDAKELLWHSDLSITQIALSVGFTDSNYFCSVFKRMVGMTPRDFRKKQRDT